MPVIKIPTFRGKPITIPPEIKPEESNIPKMRSDEAARLVSGQFNENTSARHYVNEVRFSFYNHSTLVKAFQDGRAVDLMELPKQKEKSALIIGSGHTLDAALPFIKDWHNDIICSTSQAATLIRWGREPEHIIALDPDSHPSEMAVPDGWEHRKSVLHLHPGVDPDIVNWWPGQMALFRKLQPQTSFYANEQNIGYGELGPKEGTRYDGNSGHSLIKAQIPMLACVAAAQICIGKHLGYRQMYLIGCDFLFMDPERTRFTASIWENDKWTEKQPLTLEQRFAANADLAKRENVVETEFDGLKSSIMQIFYAHQVVIAWRITETNIVNASPKGLLRMFPSASLEEIWKHQDKGIKAFNLNQIRQAAEEHLAKQNIYFLWVGKGVMPHEFKDPLHEVPKLITQLEGVMKAQDRAKEFDAEANRRRIERLFKKVAKREEH